MNSKNIILFAAIIIASITLISCGDSSVDPSDKYDDPNFSLVKTLDWEVEVATHVYGEYSDRVVIEFKLDRESVGEIELTPTEYRVDNVTLQSDFGPQYINVYTLQLTPPNQFVPGQVHIDCEFSDENGVETRYFAGLLSAWAM